MNSDESKAPTEIKRLGTSGIEIAWNDGVRTHLSSEVLRKHCPCAGCKEARGDSTHAKPLTGKRGLKSLAIVQNDIETELTLQQIWGVGQYALGMSWADGHDSGIYTFSYLRELAATTTDKQGTL